MDALPRRAGRRLQRRQPHRHRRRERRGQVVDLRRDHVRAVRPAPAGEDARRPAHLAGHGPPVGRVRIRGGRPALPRATQPRAQGVRTRPEPLAVGRRARTTGRRCPAPRRTTRFVAPSSTSCVSRPRRSRRRSCCGRTPRASSSTPTPSRASTSSAASSASRSTRRWRSAPAKRTRPRRSSSTSSPKTSRGSRASTKTRSPASATTSSPPRSARRDAAQAAQAARAQLADAQRYARLATDIAALDIQIAGADALIAEKEQIEKDAALFETLNGAIDSVRAHRLVAGRRAARRIRRRRRRQACSSHRCERAHRAARSRREGDRGRREAGEGRRARPHRRDEGGA